MARQLPRIIEQKRSAGPVHGAPLSRIRHYKRWKAAYRSLLRQCNGWAFVAESTLEVTHVHRKEILLGKIDLLEHVPFDEEAFRADLRNMREDLPVLPVSAVSGEGIEKWITWLMEGSSS